MNAAQQNHQGQRDRRPPKPKFELICSAGSPAKVGDQYQISVNVQLSKDGMNQRGKQVEVLYNGASVYSNLVTDDSGRASGQFPISAKAGDQVELTAVLLGPDHATRTIRVSIPAESKPTERLPHKADLEEIGKDGSYSIVGQVVDSNDRGVKARLIFNEILGKNEKSILINGSSQETEDDGSIKILLRDFKEAKRTIEVRVAGTMIERTLILRGPTQSYFRKPVKGGFRKNFRRK